MRPQPPRLVTIGYIERAHGVNGKVRVRPTTDEPQRFRQLKRIYLETQQGEKRALTVSDVSVQGELIYLQFQEVRSREEANALKGATLNIERQECLPLQSGRYYYFDLIGSKVITTENETLGLVEDVWDLPANDVLIVRSEEREYLIPTIKEVVKKVDTENGVIIVHVMEGLLE